MIQNKFQFIGRLTKDVVYMAGNENKSSYAYYDIAVDKNKEETDFVHLVAFSGTADFISKYTSKGTLIAVEGRVDFSREVEIVTQNGTSKIVIPSFVVEDVRSLAKPYQPTEEA